LYITGYQLINGLKKNSAEYSDALCKDSVMMGGFANAAIT